MDRNEYRDDEEDDVGAPDTYWRRRAITLALGLGLLGILAWGFSGGGAKRQVTPLPATALGTAVPGAPSSGPAAATSGATGSSGAVASPASPASASGTGSASPVPSASVSPGTPKPNSSVVGPSSSRQHQSGLASSAASTGCGPGSVVLSLFTDRTSYGAQQFPRFSVYAVSTTSAGCTFSPEQLQVMVLASDRVIWDSTDCARADAHARDIAMARGVPVQDEVVWNRDITLPGCQVLAVAAHPGSYVVQARSATVQSPPRYFKLTG